MATIAEVVITGPVGDWLAGFAGRLVADRLAASANIVGGLRSIYRWRGVVRDEPEVMAILHTRAALVPAIVDRVDAEHPYELPGVRHWVVEVTAAYGRWVVEATGGDS